MQTQACVRLVVAGDVVSGENRYNPYPLSTIAHYRRRHNEAITESRVYGHRRSVSAIKNRACVYVKSFNVSLFTVARYTLIFPQQIRLPLFFPGHPLSLQIPSSHHSRLPLYIRDISYAGRSHGKNANFRCRPHNNPPSFLSHPFRSPLPSFSPVLFCAWRGGRTVLRRLFITEYLARSCSHPGYQKRMRAKERKTERKRKTACRRHGPGMVYR